MYERVTNYDTWCLTSASGNIPMFSVVMDVAKRIVWHNGKSRVSVGWHNVYHEVTRFMKTKCANAKSNVHF